MANSTDPSRTYLDPDTGELTDQAKELVKRAGGLGSTDEQIGRLLGVSKSVWARFCLDHPEVYDLIDEGKAHAELVISNSLFARAKEGDIGAIRWYETTRAKRAEQIEVRSEKSYVIRGPADMTEEKWIEQFSPPSLAHAGSG